MRNRSESTPVIDEEHHSYKLYLFQISKAWQPSVQKFSLCPDSPAAIYSIFVEVLQRRADSGTDLPPPRAQRSEISSRKGDLKYEYKLSLF